MKAKSDRNKSLGRLHEMIASDLARHRPNTQPTLKLYLRTLVSSPGLVASTIIRIQGELNNSGRTRSAWALRNVSIALTGTDMAPGAQIGPGLLITHPQGIVIGPGVVTGANCTLLHNVTLGERYGDGSSPHDYPSLGKDVTIGAGACILGAVQIGNNVSVGANSVVLINIPDNSVAVGLPARIVSSSKGGSS